MYLKNSPLKYALKINKWIDYSKLRVFKENLIKCFKKSIIPDDTGHKGEKCDTSPV